MIPRRRLVIASVVTVVLAVAVTVSTLLPPLPFVGDTSPTESTSSDPSTDSDDSETPDERLPTFQEHPEFRERVQAGELPPVEERLPDSPKVIEPHDE